jgi:hypothetical protein
MVDGVGADRRRDRVATQIDRRRSEHGLVVAEELVAPAHAEVALPEILAPAA